MNGSCAHALKMDRLLIGVLTAGPGKLVCRPVTDHSKPSFVQWTNRPFCMETEYLEMDCKISDLHKPIPGLHHRVVTAIVWLEPFA
jgi:hypothetical protein